MASINCNDGSGSDHHDKLLNMNKNIALSSVERDLELHNLETYLKAYQENYNNLEKTVKLFEASFEKKIVKNNYVAQNLQLVEDNLQLWKTLVKEVQEKIDLTMDVQRLENQIDQQNQERGNTIMKRLQNVLKDKVDILEMKPLAQKRHKLIIKNQKIKIKIAISKQSISDQKEKNKAIRNIRKKQEQIKIIKFVEMMVENKKKQSEKKILNLIEKNKIDEKKVLNNAKVPETKIITFEDSNFYDELMQIGTSKYPSELLDVSKRLQKLSAQQNSPEIMKNNHFVIPEIKSSFSGFGNKILDSLKNNPMFNNTISALIFSENQINSSEDNSPSKTSKLKSQLFELANNRKQQYNYLPKTSNFSPLLIPEPSTSQKNSSVSSINVLTQQKRVTHNLPDQLTPPIKKTKLIAFQDDQPGKNAKENITNNLSQSIHKNFAQKQLNLPSMLSPKITLENVIKNLSQNTNSFLSSPKTIQRSQPQIIVNTADDSQKQMELNIKVPEASGPIIKSSYFPSQTDIYNLNESTSDKVSSQLIPSNYSTQDSEQFRLSSDLENQQNSGQQSVVVEEYVDGAVNMGDNDFLLENPHTTEDDYGLDVNDIELVMPNFSPYVSPTLPNIVEDEKQENTSNDNNNSFMFNFGKPQKSSSFFNMF